MMTAYPANDFRVTTPRHDETTLAIHGLDVDGTEVRAGVFVQKLREFISALRRADKLENGRYAHDFLLSQLHNGSAVATVRERPRNRKPSLSSIHCFERITTAVYNGDLRDMPSPDTGIVERIEKISKGANKRFSHGEISFADNSVIRVDDYLERQARDAKHAPRSAIGGQMPSYKGTALGVFDGVLKQIDSRGTLLRGKLVLAPSATEIDCVMNKDRVPSARESFDKRVVIRGTARYDGRGDLPVRVDVLEIRTVKQMADLTRWKGAFVFSESDDDEDL